MAPKDHPISGKQLALPSIVVGTPDIARLRRELESLYEYLHQSALRHTRPEDLKLPKTSRMLSELAKVNDINLLNREDYDWVYGELERIRKEAPQIHVSFAADPSAVFLEKIVVWFRFNIHPQLLVQVGLQPTIAAGCVVRTANRQFDLSLRRHFDKSRRQLLDKLEATGE